MIVSSREPGYLVPGGDSLTVPERAVDPVSGPGATGSGNPDLPSPSEEVHGPRDDADHRNERG